MRKLIDKYESYFDDLVTLYDITGNVHTLRIAVTEFRTIEDGEIYENGANVEVIGQDKNDDEIIKAIYEELKDDYEETDLDYTTDYNSYINTRLYASFTTYGTPGDIEDIITAVEKRIA